MTSIADLDVMTAAERFACRPESWTAEEREYFEVHGIPLGGPFDLDWLLHIAGPYFYKENGDRCLPDDDELFDRLDRFGRLIHRLTSPTRQEHATQIWIDYLKTSLGELVPAPWRTVKAAIEAGKAGEQAGTSVGFEWLDDTELEKLPTAEDLVAGHITEGSTVVLYGPPGSGKTFVALDVALCIGTSQPWFSNEVRQGRVAYIVAEGEGGMGKRVRAWKAAYLSPGESANVKFLPQPVEFMRPEDTDRLLNDLRTWDPPPKLVVIDTLAQCLVGGDENSSRDMGLLIHATTRLRHELGCTVLIIHHTGWDSKHERGSTALRGAADTTIRVEKEYDEIILTCEKMKETEPFERLRLKLNPCEQSCVLARAVHDPDRLTKTELSALKALIDIVIGDEGATTTEWKTAAAEVSNARDTSWVSVPHASFYRATKSLTENGYVEKRGNRYHVTSKGYEGIKVST